MLALIAMKASLGVIVIIYSLSILSIETNRMLSRFMYAADAAPLHSYFGG